MVARHDIGVLALPAESGGLGERLFHDRSCVYKDLQFVAAATSQRASAFSRFLMTS